MKQIDEVIAEIKASVQPFYIYILYKPSGVPFYVGKGQEYRIAEHELDAKRQIHWSKNKHKLSTIKKIHRAGKAVLYSIDSWHDTEDSVNQREIELIAQIGRKCINTGPLTNLTAGGDGSMDLPEELRQQISEKLKQFNDNPERRKILTEQAKAYQQTPEAREQARQRAIENKSHEAIRKWEQANPEQHAAKLARHSDEMKLWYSQNPEKAKQLAANRNKILRSPEHRKKMSERTSNYAKANPEAIKASREKVRQLNEQKAALWQQCLDLLRDKLIAEGKLEASWVDKSITQKKLWKLKKAGIIQNIPSGFASVETLTTFHRSLCCHG